MNDHFSTDIPVARKFDYQERLAINYIKSLLRKLVVGGNRSEQALLKYKKRGQSYSFLRKLSFTLH